MSAPRHVARTYARSFTRGEFVARCSCGWESHPLPLTDAEGAAQSHEIEAEHEDRAAESVNP